LKDKRIKVLKDSSTSFKLLSYVSKLRSKVNGRNQTQLAQSQRF